MKEVAKLDGGCTLVSLTESEMRAMLRLIGAFGGTEPQHSWVPLDEVRVDNWLDAVRLFCTTLNSVRTANDLTTALIRQLTAEE